MESKVKNTAANDLRSIVKDLSKITDLLEGVESKIMKAITEVQELVYSLTEVTEELTDILEFKCIINGCDNEAIYTVDGFNLCPKHYEERRKK